MTRNDMTQAECEGSFRDCERTWRSETCADHPEVRELHMGPGVPALVPDDEARTPGDEECPPRGLSVTPVGGRQSPPEPHLTELHQGQAAVSTVVALPRLG